MIWNSTTCKQNKQSLLSVWHWLWSHFYSKHIELPTSPHTIPSPLNFAFITLFLPSASHIPEPPTKAYCQGSGEYLAEGREAQELLNWSLSWILSLLDTMVSGSWRQGDWPGMPHQILKEGVTPPVPWTQALGPAFCVILSASESAEKAPTGM